MIKPLVVTLGVIFGSVTIAAPGPNPDMLKIDIHTSNGDEAEQTPFRHKGAPPALVHQLGDGMCPVEILSFPLLLRRSIYSSSSPPSHFVLHDLCPQADSKPHLFSACAMPSGPRLLLFVGRMLPVLQLRPHVLEQYRRERGALSTLRMENVSFLLL